MAKKAQDNQIKPETIIEAVVVNTQLTKFNHLKPLLTDLLADSGIHKSPKKLAKKATKLAEALGNYEEYLLKRVKKLPQVTTMSVGPEPQPSPIERVAEATC